ASRVPNELQLGLEVPASDVADRNVNMGRRHRLHALVVSGLHRIEFTPAGTIGEDQPLQIASGPRLISDNGTVFAIAVGLHGQDGDTSKWTAGPVVYNAGHAHRGSPGGGGQRHRVRGEVHAGA